MQAEVWRMEGLRLTLPQMIADLTEALSVAQTHQRFSLKTS